MIFITGTDTGVGKTFVAGAIAAYLRSKGKSVGVMKPVETGCREKRGELVPADAVLLKKLSGTDDPLEMICPYAFTEPIAPAVAAKRAKVRINIGLIEEIFKMLSERHDVVIVEGAGGLMVPLSGKFLYLDLVESLKIPLLIVGRAGLGTINHTMLTVDAAIRRKIEISGIILNQAHPAAPGVAEATNPKVLRELTGIKEIRALPYAKGAGRSVEALIAVGRELSKLGFLA